MQIQLTSTQEQKFQDLAAVTHRTPDQLAQEALDGYCKYVESLAENVREGEESAERDGWLTHEEVFERLNKRLLKTAWRHLDATCRTRS